VEEEATDRVNKLTEVEALRFGKLDAEMRNHIQGMRIASLEIDSLQREAREKVAQLEERKAQIKRALMDVRPEYDSFIKKLAKKYGVPDPDRVLIDPDTGIIRDSKTDI
jgi:phosphopantetheine adenylyltransferase